MNATDTPFFRAFAGRVRTTIADTPKGDTTVTTTQPLHGKAADQVRDQLATTVPATFQTDPDAPCSAHAWCTETGHHLDHTGRQVSLPTSGKLPPILTAHLYTDQPAGLPEMNFDPGHDDWREFHSGAELRAETARVRTHLARLDAFADEYDALREAAGETVEEATLQPELIARVEVEAAALSEGTALLFKQYGDLLRVAFDPDHVTEEKTRELVALFVSPQAAALIDAPAPAAVEFPPAARRWTITTTNGIAVSGHLPSWADEMDDPSESDLSPDRLHKELQDVTFTQCFDGFEAEVNRRKGGKRQIADFEILAPRMDCNPFSENGVERVPTVSVELAESTDDWIEYLDPDGVAILAEKLRAQADRLMNEVRPALIAARADWAKNGSTR